MSDPDIQRIYDKLESLGGMFSDLRVALVEATTKLEGLGVGHDKIENRINYLEKRDETLGWKILLALLSGAGAVFMVVFQFYLNKGGK